MKSRNLLAIILGALLIAVLVSGCAAPAAPAADAPAADEAATEEPAEEAASEEAAAEAIYIPVISKGFQHQFWQAVQKGAEQAAADLRRRDHLRRSRDRGHGRQAGRDDADRAGQEPGRHLPWPLWTARR